MSTPRRNEFDQPIGPVVADWAPCPFPDVTTMQGEWCRVEPLMLHHADELYDELCLPSHDPLWTYLPIERPGDRAAFAAHVDERAETTDAVSVVLRNADGVACGMASYLRIDPGNGAVEIGWILLGPRLQRTTAATEAMYLLAKHAFDLGYRRYEWKCDALNQASLRAAQRLGFTFEGTFRNAVVYKDRSRDTAWFSISDAEWPRVDQAFVSWLASDNHGGGKQIRSLEAVRTAL